MGFMKMHTETVRRYSYLMLVPIKSQSEFGCFLAEQSDWLKNPIGLYVVFSRSAVGDQAICSSTMAAIAASSVSIAPARVAAARQSRSRARAAVVVKASADERQVRGLP